MVLDLLGYTGIKLVSIGIEIANICLLSGLLYLYIKSYRQIKIGFTVGLMLFATVLLLRSLFTIGFIMVDNTALGRPIYIG
ncbi:MAG: hypothetical protein K8E24_001365, partial [Methanobacterium paludis]|nr:hypothetical protein [Methanobacterium paludis]